MSRTWDKKEVMEFVSHMTSLYFNRRDMEGMISFMEERTSWIGSGRDEVNRNLCEIRDALGKDAAEYSGSFKVTDIRIELVPLSDVFCVIYGSIHAQPEDKKLSEEELRLSAVLEQTEGHIKLVHVHCSHADDAQEQGHYFVMQNVRADNQTLRHELDTRSRLLATLTKNIPGGVHQCANDDDLSILSMSDGFLSMFGYTRDEIKDIFDDKFMNMIYPADREELKSTVKAQLENGCGIELEYRVICKDGLPVWVLDKGRLMDNGQGGQCFYCLLIEMSDRKRQQEELRLSLERHQVIMDQATDIIFEWDIRMDTLSFSTNWYKKFGYEAMGTNISENILASGNIYTEDIPDFMNAMKEIISGIPYTETEIRIRNADDQYSWFRIRATTQYDSESRPIKAVGVIIDIDTEKRQKQELLDQAQRDALTGLYNKAAVNVRVEQLMSNRGIQGYEALLIIDIDFFKSVNDTYGHLCGDSVLSDVAVALKSCTRSSDVVGRIGGDEFLVYLPEVADEAAVQQKAKVLLDTIQKITPRKGVVPITCSIGAAVFERGTIDYYTLYKCADQALYQKKKNGRSGVAYCDEDTSPSDPELETSNEETALGDIDIIDESLSQYAFRVLYGTTDIEFAISQLLEIIGRSFDVSRVYIFESSDDGLRCSNTFEWCNTDITPQISILQNIAYVDALGDYLTNFDSGGMFYCHDIESLHPDVYAVLEPQGIRSMLQCAMLDEGKFVGYVGFDECRENRSWSFQQVVSFKLTADVLSTFLVKLRQKQKLRDRCGMGITE